MSFWEKYVYCLDDTLRFNRHQSVVLSSSENTPLMNFFQTHWGVLLREEKYSVRLPIMVIHGMISRLIPLRATVEMYVRKQVIFFFKEENYLNRTKLIRKSRSPYTVASQLKQNRLYFV